MTELVCYRCGGSLAELSLPLSRRDLCPQCDVELHVCRMCGHFAPGKPDDCDEEDAIAVRDKQSANFCDYFDPSPEVFTGRELAADQSARARLEAMFESEARAPEAAPGADDGLAAAEDLFKK